VTGRGETASTQPWRVGPCGSSVFLLTPKSYDLSAAWATPANLHEFLGLADDGARRDGGRMISLYCARRSPTALLTLETFCRRHHHEAHQRASAHADLGKNHDPDGIRITPLTDRPRSKNRYKGRDMAAVVGERVLYAGLRRRGGDGRARPRGGSRRARARGRAPRREGSGRTRSWSAVRLEP